MTRFDEVARLITIIPPTGIIQIAYTKDLIDAAPWLLEAAACFQPGDAALMGEILSLHREFERDYPDENPGWSDLFARMEKAAAIMEGQE